MSWLTRISRKDMSPRSPGGGAGDGSPGIHPEPTNVSPGVLLRGQPPKKEPKRYNVDKALKTPDRKRKGKL